ncbi:origin recognition complex subunit 2-like [Anopheles albimanus]|uniref:Origin recognition complex subunit 2 n=1 Tax=Anopheles albimanus TaxID=7167 RepID=A0A182FPD9_ANOAL|nr:origin recognition complex subunit 2-like [Anopheles albimanus]
MSRRPLEETPQKAAGDRRSTSYRGKEMLDEESPELPVIDELPERPQRRSLRARVRNRRYIDTSQSASDEENDANAGRANEEEDEIEELGCKVSSAMLFEDQHDVAGKSMYGFRTPKKRDSMRKLAAQASAQRRSEVLRTPTTPRTPTSLRTPSSVRPRGLMRLNTATIPQTPAQVRQIRKRAIGKALRDADEESDASYSAESTASDTESSNTSQSESDDAEEISEAVDTKSIRNARSRSPTGAIPKTTIPNVGPPKKRTMVKSVEHNYVPNSEHYFSNHTATKTLTSNHTLDLLATSRLPRDLMQRLLKENSAPLAHRERLQEAYDNYSLYFRKWMFLLAEGCSVMLYGIGSKLFLTQHFIDQMLRGYPVVLVQGYFPDLSIKDVLDLISSEVLKMRLSTANTHEALDKIERQFSKNPELHLFLVVNNLDGTALRNEAIQSTLGRLAAINNVHLIASIDNHIAPAMWDTSNLSAYNFVWFDVTTLHPYTVETSFENSLMVQNADAPAFDAMKRVVCSLTSNARGIFNTIVNYQLTNQKEQQQQYAGMAMPELYRQCRESFLVSSDAALRCQLTEFFDHKLLRFKRNYEGTEAVHIPLSLTLLQRFVDEQGAS